MAYKLQLKPHDTVAKLKQAIKSSKNEAQKTRIRAIIKLKQGTIKDEVADDFVVSKKTILYWMHCYNKNGVAGLKMNKGGRPKGNHKWNQSIFNELVKEIDKGGKCWSIPMMQDWIEENHKEKVPEQTVWYHIDKLGYSYKSSRPHPYKGDREKQQVFKKRAWSHI